MTEQHTTPDFRRIEQFVAVAEAGTLAAAAEQLFLTQQALSTAIRKLEAELGVDLFDRSGRTLALTAAGQALVDELMVLGPEVHASQRLLGAAAH